MCHCVPARCLPVAALCCSSGQASQYLENEIAVMVMVLETAAALRAGPFECSVVAFKTKAPVHFPLLPGPFLVSRVLAPGEALVRMLSGGQPCAFQSWARCGQCWCQTAGGVCGPGVLGSVSGSPSDLPRQGWPDGQPVQWAPCRKHV